jgi:hypothetical protein
LHLENVTPGVLGLLVNGLEEGCRQIFEGRFCIEKSWLVLLLFRRAIVVSQKCDTWGIGPVGK